MLALHGTRLNARQRLPPYSRLPHQIPRNKSSVRHHKRDSHQAHKVDIRETRHSGSGYIRQLMVHNACKQYQECENNWEFKHITSSPYHPEANGKAERTVQTIKSLLKKAAKNEEDLYLALLNFRACPGPDETPAPATKLMNRPIRTRLPRVKEETSHQEKVLEKQLKQKQYYDL